MTSGEVSRLFQSLSRERDSAQVALGDKWYRNAGRRNRYHLASSNWVRSGKAVCGADISRPGFVARDVPAVKRALQEPCAHCLTRT